MSFNTALTGLKAASSDLDIIGNNVANTGTTGFKRSRGDFKDIYAASVLGSSSNAIGAGVRLASVQQQFTRGAVSFTENNLDLAINGSGFFVLNNGGTHLYSRSGAFNKDEGGYLVDSGNRRLMGFLADAAGNIGGTVGDLQISGGNQLPRATQNVDFSFNLDSSATLAPEQWVGTSSFGGASPEVMSYNYSTSSTVYDSLGNSHSLNLYMIKTSSPNIWDTRVQVDGVDVYTLDAKPNSYTSKPTPLSNVASLPTIGATDLTLNGVPIPIPSTDGVSSVDPSLSAIAISHAINTTTATTGITATVNPTVLNLGLFTPGTLSGTNFTVNGTNVAATDMTTLLTSLNAISGISAVDNNGQVILTASDGRNIEVKTAGNVTGASFSNFDLGQGAKDQVQRGTYTMSSSAPIDMAGDAPANAGLYAGTVYAPFKQYFNSDGSFNATFSEPITVAMYPVDTSGAPNGALAPQSLTVAIHASTQFGAAFAVHSADQDGYTTGELDTLDIDATGVIYGRYTNGQAKALGRVALANFANTQGLQPMGDTSWGETFNSGTALIGTPGTNNLGLLQSGALEESNVNLTEELVDLIVAQRNFQANAQAIRTEDAATQAIINIR